MNEARKYLKHLVWGTVLVLTCSVLHAQDYDPNGKPHEDKGPTASEIVSGSSNSIGGMVKLDTSIGWNFTKNFGVDVGVPVMFATRPGIFAGTSNRLGYVTTPFIGCTFFFGCYTGYSTSSRIWTGELADGYVEAHYTRPYKRYNFATNITGDLPTASYRKGLTTGRVQWDWFNHIDTDVHGFSPFVNFGLANGRMDQHFLPRPFNTDLPFRTLGYLADFEGGVQYKVFRRLTVGFSVWDILPFGPQKIYSNLVWEDPGQNNILAITGPAPNSALPASFRANKQVILPLPSNGTIGTYGYLAGDPNHGRYWNTAFETVGPNWIDRDNGFSPTLSFSPAKFMDVELAYSHSVRYALDSVYVTLGFNANAVFRKFTNY